jgi:phosphoglycolate phosphatase-like HAD superfamily hydrolase
MFGLPDGVSACLFDMDGVVTQTAVVHAAAWKEMFDDFLRARAQSTETEFALVVGVDRAGQAEELAKHGANIVVQDLAELLGKDAR